MKHTSRFDLDMQAAQPVRPISAMQIIKQVAEKHGLTVDDLRSQDRSRKYSWPRQEAMVRLRDETALSYPSIARLLRRKDHTTIIYGERVARNRIKEGSEEWNN